MAAELLWLRSLSYSRDISVGVVETLISRQQTREGRPLWRGVSYVCGSDAIGGAFETELLDKKCSNITTCV